MPDEEVTNEVSEDDLFNETVSDEKVEADATSESGTTEPESPEQPRDDAGKFAKADDEPVVGETAAEEKSTVDDSAAQVPSWRVREINEEKRALADKVAALEAERLHWQQREKPAEVKVEKPDPLLDPEAYEKYLETKFEEKLLNDRRELSLASAHKTYKTEFEEAYTSAQKNLDPALKARMQLSRDPGETLIAWHREQKTMREVGNDPNAWLEKKLEERLSDPSFLAKAVEKARGVAQPQSSGRPKVELPPSLSGASRSNAALRSDTSDLSDHDLFEQTTTG